MMPPNSALTGGSHRYCRYLRWRTTRHATRPATKYASAQPSTVNVVMNVQISPTDSSCRKPKSVTPSETLSETVSAMPMGGAPGKVVTAALVQNTS